MPGTWRDRFPGRAAQAARFSHVAVWPSLLGTALLGVLWLRGDGGLWALFSLMVTLTLTFLVSIAWAASDPRTGFRSPRQRCLVAALGAGCIAWAIGSDPLGWLAWFDLPVPVRGWAWLVGFGGLWLLKRVAADRERGCRSLGPTGL